MNDYVVSIEDLEELHRCGAVHLPNVAVQHSEVASALHKTALSEGHAFHRSIGGTSPVQAAFAALRNRFQDDITVRSVENLLSAGVVLTQIADSFATADYLNAEDLQKYQDYLDGLGAPDAADRDRPPPYVPDPPSSDDPHPEEQQYPPGL